MRCQTSVGTDAKNLITSISVLRTSWGGRRKLNTAGTGSLGFLYTDPILMRLLRPREGL